MPDFQGGVVVYADLSIYRLDGLTGQPYAAYVGTTDEDRSNGLEVPAVHTDGTIFTVDYSCAAVDCPNNSNDTTTGAWVVGIDPSSGGAKFKIPLANSTEKAIVSDSFCGTVGSTIQNIHSWSSGLMIAGDGFAYTTYLTDDGVDTQKKSPVQPYPTEAYSDYDSLLTDTGNSNFSAAINDLEALWQAIGQPFDSGNPLLVALQSSDSFTAGQLEGNMERQFLRLCDSFGNSVTKLHVLRVGSDGSCSDFVVNQWTESHSSVNSPSSQFPFYTSKRTQTGPIVSPGNPNSITNADQGALFSWNLHRECGDPAIQTDPDCVGAKTENHLTTTAGGGHDGLQRAVAIGVAGLH